MQHVNSNTLLAHYQDLSPAVWRVKKLSLRQNQTRQYVTTQEYFGHQAVTTAILPVDFVDLLDDLEVSENTKQHAWSDV